MNSEIELENTIYNQPILNSYAPQISEEKVNALKKNSRIQNKFFNWNSIEEKMESSEKTNVKLSINNENDILTGQIITPTLFVEFYSTTIKITDILGFSPGSNRKIKRYKKFNFYSNAMSEEDFTKYKIKVLEKVYLEKDPQKLISELMAIKNKTSDLINYSEDIIQKNEIPSFNIEKKNDHIEIRYNKFELSATDLKDKSKKSLYLDVNTQKRKALVRFFETRFKFSEDTTFDDLQQFLRECFNGHVPYKVFSDFD